MAHGQDCIVERDEPIETKVSIKRSTKAARDISIRASYWEGLIPLDIDLLGGEIISIFDPYRSTKYLVQHTNYDPQSRQTAFFGAKCNSIIRHMRYITGIDEGNNLIKEWRDVDPDKVYIDCYGMVINQRIRQEMPGLLEGTIYLFQVPKSLGVVELDRFVYNDKPYMVASIDDIGLEGIDLIQLSKDVRPD